MNKVLKIKDAQKIVKDFAVRNGWGDEPNIDKFDHVHEELIEMSKHLRYKKSNEMIKYIRDNKDIFEDGIGDTLFALCRLANQLGIDMTKSFNLVSKRILDKYNNKGKETKIIKKS
jgi:NTP pyrophosphatase (non-canonical NTP hydrolase)